MSDDKDKILELYKFCSADDLKSVQTKLTKLSNGILIDAVSARIKCLFTDAEITTLESAAKILASIKTKVEHAKEVKARQERLDAQRYEDYERKARELISSVFKKPDTHQEMRMILLWRLACLDYMKSYSYIRGVDFVRNDIKQMHDLGVRRCSPNSLATVWLDEIKPFIRQEIWRYDEEPNKEKLDAVIIRFNEEFVSRITEKYADLIAAFDNELLIENSENVTRIKK